jgi:hypothetical protein
MLIMLSLTSPLVQSGYDDGEHCKVEAFGPRMVTSYRSLLRRIQLAVLDRSSPSAAILPYRIPNLPLEIRRVVPKRDGGQSSPQDDLISF